MITNNFFILILFKTAYYRSKLTIPTIFNFNIHLDQDPRAVVMLVLILPKIENYKI